MLSTYLRGKAEHEKMPFHVEQALENGRFIHVFDEIIVNFLLNELGAVPDFIAYLRKKEEILGQPGVIVSVPGEEDLLARYMATSRNDEHAFHEMAQGIDYVALPEGDWGVYLKSP